MAAHGELLELSKHLKHERLFISSEREQLQALNEDVSKTAEKLYHLSWITRHQKLNLDGLILANKNATPEVCCQRANAMENVIFVDGYRHLTYHENKIGELMKWLRESPKMVARCLVIAEKTNLETMNHMTQITMSGLYGNAVMQEDENLVLQVLKALIDMQVAASDSPRKLLRKGSCAFSVVFKLLNEGLFNAKLFLTAALHKPVMQLLMEDEWFYDIDPDRALHRFPNAERQKRFSQPGTTEFQNKTKQYRQIITNKLAMLAERFINSVKNNMYCFPQSLAWIVSQLYHAVTKAGHVNATEARAMCADLVLTFFICPAICDPEAYGITSDAPISYIARHNLMQVAQILQVLAISKWEEVDPKIRDVYGKFEKGCMSFLLDAVLDTPTSDVPIQTGSPLQGLSRVAGLLTLTDLTELLNFLRTAVSKLEDGSPEHKELETFLENVPSPAVIQSIQAKSTPNTTPQPTPPGTPSTGKKLSKGKERKRLNLTPDDPDDDSSGSRSDLLEDVLVISLGVSNECPGMLSEQKVLEQEVKQRKFKSNSLIPGEDDPISESEIHLHEKRTRFSLSHDQDSIATSDNLEAISEAASSHSVGSDLENENDNDNLSDMVSANVSGRGTPNISGRDTPISQADSQAESVEEIRAPDLPVLVQKTNREDVTDRFGKFEIKQELERDEVKSTVSDTWSTDVLASDSEPPESNQLERLEEVAEEVARQNLLGIQIHEVSEVSETASDAWSTDVLASDTSEKQVDRLLELDQDEIGSVSSRGQGPDSELGEAQDQAEDTPQASGQQSPKALEPGEDLVDVGGIGEDDVRDVLEAPGFRPLTGDSARRKPDRYSDPTHDRSGDYTDLLKEEDKQRAVSDMIGLYHGMEQGKGDYVPNARISSSFQYTVGKVTSVLEVFDPLSASSNSKPVSEDSPEYLSIQVEEKSLCSSSHTLVSEGALSPDRSDQNEATLTRTSEVGENTKLPDSDMVTSEASVTVKSTNQNEPILRPTANKPHSEETESLKLTEQQNFKIDANRLSNSPATLFDPLMPENGTDSGGGTRPRSASDGFTPIAPKPYTSGRSGSYSNQGARPKVTPVEQQVTPRIAFKVNSVEIDLNGSIGGDNPFEADKVPAQSRTSQQTGRESSASKDSKNTTAEVSSGDKLNNSEDVKIKRSNLNSEEMKMRRSSTDSSESSTEMQSATSGSRVASAEISVKPDESRESADMKDEVDGKKKAGTSFFRSFKERLVKGPFPVTVSVRGGKSKVTKHGEKDKILRNGGSGDPGINFKTMSFDASDEHLIRTRPGVMQRAQSEDPSGLQLETTDDILAKYRKQPSPMKPGSSSNMATESANHSKDKEMPREEEQESPPSYDPNNLETCKAFWDAKKKLRLVLSNADFQAMTCSTCYHGSMFLRSNNNERKENELVAYLKAQLAEAINLQDKHVVAQLHETIRCLRQFDNQEMKRLLRIMKEEYRSRSPYISYLVRCRQGLLATHSHLERLLTRVQRDKMICNKYFLSVFVRLFLEKREKQLMKFIADFQKLTVADEKTDLVERFLSYLHSQMDKDPIWQVASEAQLDDSKLYIERSVMSHVYTHAMFPNGDGDIMRDQILHEHVKKLSKVITTRHSDLRIPKVYHYEAPWPAAQEEIFMINAYKTPKDKLQCVLRCSSTIMNLLSLANEKSVPAADDFMPVLIYVLIKANPPCLLSTVQYVTSFYEKRLQGEEQYWWMQFAAAIEFIKTMDYGD